MRAYGLTGNIGCGKSTVAEQLGRYLDVRLFDCDQIAKAILMSGQYRQQLTTLLGVDVYAGTGKPDFPQLSRIIFTDPDKRQAVEELLHPLVWQAVETAVAKADPYHLCVVESAIIYETDKQDQFSGVIVAHCPPAEQVRRLQLYRRMNPADIAARMETQLPTADKLRHAQFSIDTNCSEMALNQQVEQLYHQLRTHQGGTP